MIIEYRKEIDGLRAVALIPVILFHAGFPLFSGGFVGVDVFFVISGYLITSIILSEMNQGAFSLTRFYERRARRIIPALFFVMLVSVILSWITLWPSHMKDFSQSLIAVSLFSSNFLFWQETGYWGVENSLKPLLHTWSLAVEEQYYVLFPLFLMIMWKFGKRWILGSFIFVVILSLVLSHLASSRHPTANFFLLPTRGWELAIGAGIAFYFLYQKKIIRSLLSHRVLDEVFGFIGFLFIGYSVFAFNENTPFPGLFALYPTIGTALIIIFSSNETIIGKLLGSKALVAIGLISYSAYLWHQPIFVFARHRSLQEPSLYIMGMLSIISLLVAFFSWKYVEAPFRKKGIYTRKQIFTLVVLGSLMFIAFGVAGSMTDGFTNRFSNKILDILATKNDDPTRTNCSKIGIEDKKNPLSICEIGDQKNENISFAVWGDSHGEALRPAIHTSALKAKAKGVFLGKGGCLPLLEVRQVTKGYENCTDTADSIIKYLSLNPDIGKIYLISRWAIYAMGERFQNERGHTVYIRDKFTKVLSLEENKKAFERSFHRTIKLLTGLGRKVIIVTQVPETEFDIPTAAAQSIFYNQDVELRPLVTNYNNRQAFVEKVIEELSGEFDISLVKPQDIICGKKYCSVLNKNGLPIYRDSNHITKTYAIELSVIFDKTFQ